MLFSIVGIDHPGSLDGRKAARPAHLARLEALKNEGRLVLAGPNPAIESDDPGEAGFTGSIVIAEFDSLADAQRWLIRTPTSTRAFMPTWWSNPTKRCSPNAINPMVGRWITERTNIRGRARRNPLDYRPTRSTDSQR